ncbi:MAG: phage portal protein [Phycisphaeraceae bacterium]
MFALLRRYSLAVCGAAEQAALVGGVIYTDMPAGGEADDVEPLEQVELERNEWWTMPAGYKAEQIRAEQPTTQYGAFHDKILNEIARCLNMPFNIAAGNSSNYNYASGRLDHQAFFKAIKIDQQRLVRVVLNPLFRAWLSEASLVEDLLPQQLRTPEAARTVAHQWFWPGFEHVDPVKEAQAQEKRLASNTTTLAEEYARQGMDWEEQLMQRARERQLIRQLAMQDEAGAARQPAAPEPDDDDEDIDDE